MSEAPVRPKRRGRSLRRLFGHACVVALVAAASAVVLPGPARAAITSNESGWHQGYYYALWTDTPGSAVMELGPGGNYRVAWNNTYEFYAGKGWNPGGPEPVTYLGTFNAHGNAYVALHGWTRSPLVEYKIVETWGTWRPPGYGFRGTVTTDDGVYDIYMTQRTGVGIINAYRQYWSVRQIKRLGGTITVANHFNAWAQLWMDLGGAHDFQIMSTLGYQSSGTSNITVFRPHGTNG